VAPVAVLAVLSIGLVSLLRNCDAGDVADRLGTAIGTESSVTTLSGSASLLSSDSESTDMIVVTQDLVDGSNLERRISRVQMTADGSSTVWNSEPIDGSASRAEVAQVADTLFVAYDDALLALDPKTGETRWRTKLHDAVTIGCARCFAAVGERLVVRTTDAHVTAYGPTSAEPQWQKRLRSTSGSISVVNDRLFIVDDPEVDQEVTPVIHVDPTNGRTLRSVSPTCPDDPRTPWELELSPADEVLPVGASDDVMAAFGFGDGCVVRWNPESGEVRWASRLLGVGSLRSENLVLGERDLVVPSSSSPLVAIDLTTGDSRALELSPDTAAVPELVVGRTLLAATATSRGTPRRGLAAWDLSNGDRLWEQRLEGDPQPAARPGGFSSNALFDGSPRLVLVPVAGGLNLFTFEGTDRTFSAVPLDVADGSLGTPVRRAFLGKSQFGTPSLAVEALDPERLIVSLDGVLQAIPASGTGALVGYP